MPQKILVVDDDQGILKAISNRLQKEGYEVFLAQDGEKALREAEYVLPDLIILDVMLPKIDGSEVYSQLQENDKLKKIPVIFLTALKTGRENREMGHDIGRRIVFGKPYDPQEFLGTIKDILKP